MATPTLTLITSGRSTVGAAGPYSTAAVSVTAGKNYFLCGLTFNSYNTARDIVQSAAGNGMTFAPFGVYGYCADGQSAWGLYASCTSSAGPNPFVFTTNIDVAASNLGWQLWETDGSLRSGSIVSASNTKTISLGAYAATTSLGVVIGASSWPVVDHQVAVTGWTQAGLLDNVTSDTWNQSEAGVYYRATDNSVAGGYTGGGGGSTNGGMLGLELLEAGGGSLTFGVGAGGRSGAFYGMGQVGLGPALGGSRRGERPGAMIVVPVTLFSGSPRREVSGPSSIIPAPGGRGSVPLLKSGAQATALAPALKGAQSLAKSGPQITAPAPAGTGPRSAQKAGPGSLFLGWSLPGTRSQERSGAILFGVATSGVGAGTRSGERSGTQGPITLGAAQVGSPTRATTGAMSAALALPIKGSLSGCKSGSEVVAPAPMGVGCAATQRIGAQSVLLQWALPSSRSCERSGPVLFGVVTSGVGAGTRSQERSGAAGVIPGAVATGGRSPGRSGASLLALACAFPGVKSLERSGISLIGVATQGVGAGSRSLERSGAASVGLRLPQAGTTPLTKSGSAEIWQLLAFAAGSGSPSRQRSGALTFSAASLRTYKPTRGYVIRKRFIRGLSG